jgi:hypothetical protein
MAGGGQGAQGVLTGSGEGVSAYLSSWRAAVVFVDFINLDFTPGRGQGPTRGWKGEHFKCGIVNICTSHGWIWSRSWGNSPSYVTKTRYLSENYYTAVHL